jgi:adenylosuccinate lyase
VQENAMKTASSGVSFLDLLLSDARLKDVVDPEDIKKLFENDFYLRYVDEIFARFFEE